jgi:ribulose-phosphate 3-epimerase
MKKVYIAPSILNADFSCLEKQIKIVEEAGAEYLHYDVMDGHFVSNISFGIPIVKSLAHRHHMINDVHIMIAKPLEYAHQFVNAGAHIVTFHYEACESDREIQNVISSIIGAGGKPAMSVKPSTPVEVLFPYLSMLHLALVMSVEPGFGGQSFMNSALEKIRQLRLEIDNRKLTTLIQVDGGINQNTAKLVIDAGADILVVGSYLFAHNDISQRIKLLRK